ncbi:MAG: hypothetical protein ACE362_20050 [Phaeodactylibacter xiamenensis]|uniref:Uncharacterized protein n=1 Tax=Phaeodactylibacter xiamenensis TaxID=1524460 RepID=A0A098S290_9BACT|nr:hypothetical protein [Phaeodactylibacter xiamenensis]KGE85893.1 hypothetical protein IX84_25125 [Phaeodactylibacter xiamenensis]MCR9051245.1 hypothetical protein [bacterium]
MKNLLYPCMALILSLSTLSSCTKDEETASPTGPAIWSKWAPHQPAAPDLTDKISNSMLHGGWTVSTSLENPTFEGFDDPALLDNITQELSAAQVPENLIQERLTLLQDPGFQFKVSNDPNTARLLLTTVNHSNEVVKSVSEAVFAMLSQNARRLIITDNPPAGGISGSSMTTIDRRVYSWASLFKGSDGKDMRAEWFNEAAEISYLVSEITPPSKNAQILQILLQTLYIMHDYASFLDAENSGSIANRGIRDNLAWLFLTLHHPDEAQEDQLRGRYFNHPDAKKPGDNPNTSDFDESTVNTMFELVERMRENGYASAPDLPYQPVPNWFAEQYETLTGAPMPNGNFADQAAIDLAIKACNTFLDNRTDARNFVKDYYGVEFP